MRILLVEDEKKLARAVQRALELQHYAVDVAFDGAEGLDFALMGNYDVIILDQMLPQMTGIEVCRAVRSAKKNTPLLMLTAKGQIRDKTTALDAGADDYMVKPFAMEELFSRIRALLRRASFQSDVLLQVADLTLDPSHFRVQRGETIIELSGKEFAILEYLMRNKNTILSKESIVDHAWNYDASILPTTVEVHIKNLREKIDKPFSIPLIHTVRGFGYEIRERK